jgi:hypothetical protein
VVGDALRLRVKSAPVRLRPPERLYWSLLLAEPTAAVGLACIGVVLGAWVYQYRYAPNGVARYSLQIRRINRRSSLLTAAGRDATDGGFRADVWLAETRP